MDTKDIPCSKDLDILLQTQIYNALRDKISKEIRENISLLVNGGVVKVFVSKKNVMLTAFRQELGIKDYIVKYNSGTEYLYISRA